jgi:hydrogenase nickel incorporation protein HypB
MTHRVTETRDIEVNQSLLRANEEAAAANRKNFRDRGIMAINLISSPGSGKTTLLEKTAEALIPDVAMGVLEGDIETELDAERIRKKGVPAVQLTTGGACHLESLQVKRGFHALEEQMNGGKPDILFIENVGNLVCPSFYDLGEDFRVVLVSVPEGDDKPLKYPKAIITSQVLIVSKADLVPYFNFDVGKVRKEALSLNPRLEIFITSAQTGEGMESWFRFLHTQLKIINRK